MIDGRLYRTAFLPALAALVAVLFSVEPLPSGTPPPPVAAGFDGGGATAATRELLESAPEREPGSAGDRDAAELVAGRFASAGRGEVTEQRFDSSQGESSNLALTLTGETEQTILIVAARTTSSGTGAATTASATGVLVELATQLASSRNERTLVLLSAGGEASGAEGLREYLGSLEDKELLEGAVAITQPGAPQPQPRFVLTHGTGAQVAGPGLIDSALRAVVSQTGERATRAGAWQELARLALPASFGEQSVLLDEGINAVGLSSHGELSLEPPAEGRERFSPTVLAGFGRAALALTLALDADGPPEPEPETHLAMDGTLIPGWALLLLGVALIAPAVAAAVDAGARAQRRDPELGGALTRTLRGALVLLVPLGLVYLLGFVGLLPRPGAPFDPGAFEPGWSGALAAVLVVLGGTGIALLVEPLRPRRASAETVAVSAGLLAALSLAGLWLLNPYLALLLAPTAHVWILAARPSISRAAVGVAVTVALVPALAATVTVASALDLGLTAPWDAVLALTSGALGLGQAVLLALLGGALLAALAAPRSRSEAPLRSASISIRGPGGHLGTGSLGGTESAIARR